MAKATKDTAAPAARSASKEFYIASTAANNTAYVEYAPGGGSSGPRRIKHRVTILGGSGVISNKTLITPQGVLTKVTAEELEFLKNNPAFQRHVSKGFLKIIAGRSDGDEVAADMNASDGSKQLTTKDFEKPPVTAASQPE